MNYFPVNHGKEGARDVVCTTLFTEVLVRDPFVADLGSADDGVADALQVGDVICRT